MEIYKTNQHKGVLCKHIVSSSNNLFYITRLMWIQKCFCEHLCTDVEMLNLERMEATLLGKLVNHCALRSSCFMPYLGLFFAFAQHVITLNANLLFQQLLWIQPSVSPPGFWCTILSSLRPIGLVRPLSHAPCFPSCRPGSCIIRWWVVHSLWTWAGCCNVNKRLFLHRL